MLAALVGEIQLLNAVRNTTTTATVSYICPQGAHYHYHSVSVYCSVPRSLD